MPQHRTTHLTKSFVCQNCGGAFPLPYHRPNAKYCSLACRVAGKVRDARGGRGVRVLRDGSLLVPISRGKSFIIDACDRGLLNRTWSLAVKGRLSYVHRTDYRTGERLYIHQAILGVPPGFEHDHVNRNPLDNRRRNLRAATSSQQKGNQRISRSTNKSGYRGVCWHKQLGKWRATLNGRHIGLFDNPEDAAVAYDAKAREHFGEFAHTNF